MHEEIVSTVRKRADTARDALEALVRIPSISADGHDPDAVVRSAEATAELLRSSGLETVRLLEVAGAHPYVYGERRATDPDAPTVLLYAHHDVQPVPTPQRWASPPFEPTERGGRLYGRGSADDKAGVVVHAEALRAWVEVAGGPPVHVKVIIEGEEEIGSPHLGDLVRDHADLLDADVVVATDLMNHKVGVPGLTYSLRGLAEVYVTVRALKQPLHSGLWGGPIPDALTGLLKALAALTGDDGSPAVPGLGDDAREPTPDERERFERLDVDEDAFRSEAGVLDGVELIGDRNTPLMERIWMQPAIHVIGVDVPSVREATNQLIAEVTAKVSIRLAPGQEPDRACRLVSEHLRANVPWGLQVETRPGHGGEAWLTEPSGPAFDAAIAALRRGYEAEPVLLGCGGSIPFVDPIARALGGVPCLLTGVEDPQTNAHGEDESLHLGDFTKACVSEALLLAEIAARGDAIRRRGT